MESQILTFCLGFGGWVGVLFSVGAFFVNSEPLGISVIAKHSIVPFISAVGFTAIVESVRFILLALNMITSAMLDRFIIMNFLQVLTSLVTGVVMGAAYYNIILPSLKNVIYDVPVVDVESEEEAGSEEEAEHEEVNDGTTETSDVTDEVSGSSGGDTENGSDKTEDEYADDESEVSVYVPARKWWPF